jgi:hypothetical protein
MNVAERVTEERIKERVEELLAPFSPEERVAGRAVSYGAAFLGCSEPTMYRYIAARRLPCMKVAGRERPGRGRAGSVRLTLLDLARFRAENEQGGAVAAGSAA